MGRDSFSRAGRRVRLRVRIVFVQVRNQRRDAQINTLERSFALAKTSCTER
jgi:hypothetical protein